MCIRDRYETLFKEKISTIGLGDSENDINMLDRVDKAVIVKHPKKPPPIIEGHPSVLITKEIGPKGWNEAMINILDKK